MKRITARYVNSQKHWLTRLLAKRQLRAIGEYIFGNDVLDIGCGCGAVEAVYGKYAHNFTSCDIEDNNIYGLSVNVCAATALPYENGQFDTVLMVGVLEHIDRAADAIQEVKRVLRPRGQFIVVIPRGILWPLAWLFRPTDSVRLHAAFKMPTTGLQLAEKKWIIPGLFQLRVYER